MKRHLVPCIIGIVAALAVLLVFSGGTGSLGVLAVALLCPLVMVLMMGGMMGAMHGHGHRHGHAHDRDENQPPVRQP